MLWAVERLKSSLTGGGRFHRQADAVGQVAAVGVVAHLGPVAEDVQRVLALEHLLDEVGHDVAHRQLDVAAHDLGVAQRPALADADAVERPQDRVRQLVLLPRALARSTRWRASGSRRSSSAAGEVSCAPSGRREDRRRFSKTIELEMTMIFLQAPVRGGADGGVEGRGGDPLVLGQQVVGELVEVADAADHRRRRRRPGRSRRPARAAGRRPWRRPRRSGSAGRAS